MKIDRVTITGADDKISPGSMERLQTEFPFVEWGVLFSSQTATGGDRYPTFKWIESLNSYNLNISGHLCGQFAKEVVYQHNVNLMDFYPHFKRFQININLKSIRETELGQLMSFPGYTRPLIHQWNRNNYQLVEKLIQDTTKKYHVLYDASGGRGTEIKTIGDPKSVYTGYAGGLGPDNVVDICEKITAHPASDTVFIDMESGVRDENNHLDLNKVRQVLELVKPYIDAS